MSCAHNGARLADLDGDGRDEVLGATVVGPDGKELSRAAEFRGHIDSVFVADVRPEKSGLDVVLLEEGSNEVQVVGIDGPIWRRNLRRQDTNLVIKSNSIYRNFTQSRVKTPVL